MSPEDAAEIRALIRSVVTFIDSDAFVAKAVGHDAVAVAKLDKDLVALRNYDYLFPTGANPRDIVSAVKSGSHFPNGGLSGITVEQVEAHAIVCDAFRGATRRQTIEIKKLALMNPDKADLIAEIMTERGIADADQIAGIIAQSPSAAPKPMGKGVL